MPGGSGSAAANSPEPHHPISCRNIDDRPTGNHWQSDGPAWLLYDSVRFCVTLGVSRDCTALDGLDVTLYGSGWLVALRDSARLWMVLAGLRGSARLCAAPASITAISPAPHGGGRTLRLNALPLPAFTGLLPPPPISFSRLHRSSRLHCSSLRVSLRPPPQPLASQRKKGSPLSGKPFSRVGSRRLIRQPPPRI